MKWALKYLLFGVILNNTAFMSTKGRKCRIRTFARPNDNDLSFWGIDNYRPSDLFQWAVISNGDENIIGRPALSKSLSAKSQNQTAGNNERSYKKFPTA